MGQITTLIPARAGSVRVPHKNTRIVAGKPLIAHAIEAGMGKIIVDTDDPQVKSIARAYGVEVVHRPSELAGPDTSIDDLLVEKYLPTDGSLIVLQPTVLHPTLPWVVEDFYEAFIKQDGAGGWSLATPERHLVWTDKTSGPTARANSQDLTPTYREIGCRIYGYGVTDPAPKKIHVVDHIFDIDTHADLAAARTVLERGRIFFRVAADGTVGSGHLYRCLALAAELDHHLIMFEFPKRAPRWAHDLVKPWMVVKPGDPVLWDGAVVVNDLLDTTIEEMAYLKYQGASVVNFEDLGPGAQYADLLINDLYPSGTHPNERTGPDWAIMRPEFAVPHAPRMGRNRVLITFGGVDPSRITERATAELGHLASKLEIRVVIPPGRDLDRAIPGIEYISDPAMAAEMADADLVLTSGGRTVWEAAAVGAPVVTILQNPREQTHQHLKMSHGIVNLGPSQLLADGIIRRTVEQLLLEPSDYLANMREGIAGLVDGRGAQRVAREIEALL